MKIYTFFNSVFNKKFFKAIDISLFLFIFLYIFLDYDTYITLALGIYGNFITTLNLL